MINSFYEEHIIIKSVEFFYPINYVVSRKDNSNVYHVIITKPYVKFVPKVKIQTNYLFLKSSNEKPLAKLLLPEILSDCIIKKSFEFLLFTISNIAS